MQQEYSLADIGKRKPSKLEREKEAAKASGSSAPVSIHRAAAAHSAQVS